MSERRPASVNEQIREYARGLQRGFDPSSSRAWRWALTCAAKPCPSERRAKVGDGYACALCSAPWEREFERDRSGSPRDPSRLESLVVDHADFGLVLDELSERMPSATWALVAKALRPELTYSDVARLAVERGIPSPASRAGWGEDVARRAANSARIELERRIATLREDAA